MPPRRTSLPTPARLAFQAAVILGLGAGFGNLATWSASTGMPFLTNLPALAESPAFALPAAADILLDISTITALEAADGNWASAMTHMPAARCIADLTDAAVQAKFTDEQAFKAMKSGLTDDKGKTTMKAAEGLSDTELKALVPFMRAMKK